MVEQGTNIETQLQQLLNKFESKSMHKDDTIENPESEEFKDNTNMSWFGSYKTKIKSQLLITGYTRLNYNKYILPSIIDIILYYFPKMNGYKFIWKIQENDTELTSIDSDPFDIGLPNKFFLRLSKTEESTSNPAPPPPPNPNPGVPALLNALAGHGYNPNPVPTTNGRTGITSNKTDDAINTYKLTLLSFQLPQRYWYQIFHIEFICHELNEQYSVIWNLCNMKTWTQSGEDRTALAQHNANMYGLGGGGAIQNLPIFPNPVNYGPNLGTGQNYGMNFIGLEWILFDKFIDKYLSETGLNIECRINVLKIMPTNINANYYYGGIPAILNNNDNEEIEEYEYESVVSDNIYNDKMKFSWNLNQFFVVDKLLYDFNNDGIMYHSDIYYDLFQLKVQRQSKDEFIWMIQLCGLPANVTQIGVKFDVFANNGIKILSQIITFSYQMAVYDFNNEQNRILYQLLKERGTLILHCNANIIQKKEGLSQTAKLPGPNDENVEKKYDDFDQNIDNKGIMKLNKSKISSFERDSFCWKIKDRNILSRLQTFEYNQSIQSEIFSLFKDEHKFVINLRLLEQNKIPQNTQQNQRLLGVEPPKIGYVRVDIGGLKMKQKDCILCKININVLELNMNTEVCQYFGSGPPYIVLSRLNYDCPFVGWPYIDIEMSKLRKLNELTIKVDMELIDTAKDDKDKDDAELNEDVKRWLDDVVRLNEYESLFKLNGIDSMHIVKSLNKDHLKEMGITKIGHQIKLLNAIDSLQ